MSKEKSCKCCKQIWYEDMLDKKWKLCTNCYEYCKPLIDDLKIKDKKITDLQSQLAEKEKEKDYYQDLYFNAVKKQERTNRVVKQFQQRLKYFSEKNQDKTSFAIEQLEKLQYTININQIDDGYTDEQVDLYELNETIDQQINELKGKVEDVKD